jgi:hypothetical protein
MTPEEKNERSRRQRDSLRMRRIMDDEFRMLKRAEQLEVQARKLLAADMARVDALWKSQKEGEA